MLPFQRILEQTTRYPNEWPLDELLRYYLTYGLVVSNRDVFLAALPCVRQVIVSSDGMIIPQWIGADCWYIGLLAGDMDSAWDHEPNLLPWVAWHRLKDGGKRLNFCARERLRGYTHGRLWKKTGETGRALVRPFTG